MELLKTQHQYNKDNLQQEPFNTRNMKRSILIFGAMIAMLTGFSQNFGEIQGKVLDTSGNPLPFIDVFVDLGGKQIGDMTDDEGKFKIKPLKPGVYSVTATFIGYQTLTMTNLQVFADEICFTPDMELVEAINEIEPAIVEAPLDLINPEQTSKISIRMAELEHSPAQKNINQIIQIITPTAYKDPNDGALYFKGARRGANVYYIDGMKIHGNVPQIPSSGIGSITVYTGGVPANYGDATGGFVVIETKNFYDSMNR
jgi:hypothetical protein